MLYKMVFQTKLLLVYGQSGTGKTSLIQCGLANKFKRTDWFELFVRRKHNLNDALRQQIKASAKTPISDDLTLPEMVESLFLDFYRPVYLIFDQFEELFILGTPEEQQQFIDDLAALHRSDVQCTVILVMREEYIAELYDFEKAIPSLFDKRLRVERMSNTNVREVITCTCEHFGISLDPQEATVDAIVNSVSEGRAGVHLPYLQMYLDRMWQVSTIQA